MKVKQVTTSKIGSDCFESLTISKRNIRYELNESEQKDNEKLNKKILAVIEGQFVVNGGTSRNGREYVKEPVNFWEYVLNGSEVKRRFKDGQVLGELGHYEGAVTEAKMKSGEVSHRVVFIDPETGKGKIYVIDTPAGNNTLTFLESGTVLYVSSRGTGSLRGNSKTVVDWETYEFETIDFVLNPGFFDAKPELTKINEELELDKTQVEDSMDKEVLEKLEKMNEAKEVIVKDNVLLLTKNESLQKEVESLKESLKTATSVNESFKSLGNETEIRGIVNEAHALIEAYKPLGSADAVKKCLELLESYKALGTPEEFKQLAEISEKYIAIGSDTDIVKTLKLQESIIEKFEKTTGGLERIQKIKKIAESYGKTLLSDTTKDLSEKYNMESEKVLKLIKKNGFNEAKEILESLSKGKDKYNDFSEDYKPELKKEFQGSNSEKPKKSVFENFKANLALPQSKKIANTMIIK